MSQKKVTQHAEPWVSVDEFLVTAKQMFDMNRVQMAGFKAYMHGKEHLPDERDFLPYIKKYLDKE